MEDASILKINLERFRRLLDDEVNPDKRRIIEELIRGAEAELQHHPSARGLPPRGSLMRGGCLK
jgi:hypothetical protein